MSEKTEPTEDEDHKCFLLVVYELINHISSCTYVLFLLFLKIKRSDNINKRERKRKGMKNI
jgi:hypothetical protein